MADNDEGSDISSGALDCLLGHLKTKWKAGEGHTRSSEYNWTRSENMAYALEQLGLFGPDVMLTEEWVCFLKDVENGMAVALKSRTFTNKGWRKICSSYLKMIRKSIETIEKAP